MKKISIAIISIILLISGCSKNDDSIKQETKMIPSKEFANDTAALTSPINTLNLNDYLFRDDIQYVDVRPLEDVAQDGYIAGFQFIPFYSFIGSFAEAESLFQMKNIDDGAGNYISAGQVGGFVAQFEESEGIINQLFSKNKKIFFISQAGSESAYLINLLIQLGYDGNLLYNVGGVTGSPGVTAYVDLEDNRYYIEGTGNYNVSSYYGILNELTPIE